MNRTLTLLLLLLSFSLRTLADEGMWLPQLLQLLNEKNMKKRGLKLKASDIYSINKSSLKDAIVSLGGFCTGEVISQQGLVLTNHHCGFDAVQNHSSLEHNYIRDGFWAADYKQELPNPGLFVTFIVSIHDVTDKILKQIDPSLSEKERQIHIDVAMAELKAVFPHEAHQELLIRSFFEGNRYYLFVTETFRDVRLVGAPPASIGNFGKDTDNWMWPRHTGDFSLFRIYADKNNRPADYSPDNVPYTPKRSLTLSLKGTREGDFTMVFGFPGRTNEYLPSAAVRQIMETNDPIKIRIRREVLETMKKHMVRDEGVKIKYAAKYASVENAYKKWQGEVAGLQRSGAVARKQAYEQQFLERLGSDSLRRAEYGTLPAKLDAQYAQLLPLGYHRDIYNEVMPRIDLFNIAGAVSAYMAAYAKDSSQYASQRNKLEQRLEDLFNEYDADTDRELFERLLPLYLDSLPASGTSPLLRDMLRRRTMKQLSGDMYTGSVINVLGNIKLLLKLDRTEFTEILSRDSLMILYADITSAYARNVRPRLAPVQEEINRLQRQYMKAQMEVFSEKAFYPDANGTLRQTYGNVKDYTPRDGVRYGAYTYMEGLMEKYKPGDYEFDVPERLRTLYENRDFGAYGVNGRMPVCFIASNHTTGGNSGSPALDARGRLIGLNFDRVWEGTMSDINYDPSICRNIMVDIRYILFIIDKFAGASHLVREMNITSN